MGTYVNAGIVYGITIDEPEWDSDAEYDEDADEPETIDYWEILKDFPLLDYSYAGDSQWDENTIIIHVRGGEVSADEGMVAAFDPAALVPPRADALAQLAAVRERIPGKRIGQPAWLLHWRRG